MSIVAAFLWNKSPRTYISTMIFDEDTMEVFTLPKIEFFAKGYLTFRRQAKKSILAFFNDIIKAYSKKRKTVRLEFKIVAEVSDIPYMYPAKESRYVRKVFLYYAKKTKQKIKRLKVSPQLRSKLTGRALRIFKRELKSLYLVQRRRDTGYEYHLWAVALHATASTYLEKINRVRRILIDAIWNEVT